VPERSLAEGEGDEETAELVGDCARTIFAESCKTVKATKPVIDRNSIVYAAVGRSAKGVTLMQRQADVT
jgi:hypothetical protein